MSILVKLSPNVSVNGFKKIAKQVELAGANAITATNTITGLAIDAKAAKPVLTNTFGGVSGPALKPIAIRCVFDAYSQVKIPIIGTGGITNGIDAAEMILAGATAVGIGTAVYYRGINVFKKINLELTDFMKSEGYKKLSDFKGKAHR